MKFCSIIYIIILTNILYSQDIINETGKDGKFIVRDNEEQEVMVIDEGDVRITGALKVEELEEGTPKDKVVVWDSEDKKFKALYNMIPKSKDINASILAADSWTEDGSGNIYRATGMVGIGTTTPERILDINPSVSGSAMLMRESDSYQFAINLKSLSNRGELLLYKDGAPTTKISGFGDNYFQGKVGIVTQTPKTNLHVRGQDGLLVQGTYGSGTILNLGEGTRMHFYPKKSAFRVGYVSQAFWDDPIIGDYSVAMGKSTLASGEGSIAIGNGTVATGANATSMGFLTVASGEHSTAMGYKTIASGFNSNAIGRGIEASGDYSLAIALSDQNGIIIEQNNTMSIMGGLVGIDEISPDFPLHIKSDIKPWGTNHAHHIKLEVPNGWWTIGIDDQEGDADLVFRSSEDTDGFTAYIDPESGNMAITSDEKLKKSIEPLSNILTEISKLEPVSYLRLNQKIGERRELGFIAQAVNDIFPMYKIANPKDETWSIFYNNFGILAIAGIKELKTEKDKEIEDLKETITILLSRIEKLENNL